MATSPAVTWGGGGINPLYPGARQIPFTFPANVTLAKGTVVGQVTAQPGQANAYASGNSDGTQVAKGILKYGIVTDASGNVSFTDTAGTAEFGINQLYAPVFISGYFSTAELVGLDATAVTALGKLVSGTVAAGQLCVTGA